VVAVRLSVDPSQIGPLFPTVGIGKEQSKQLCFQVLPSHILKQLLVVLKIIKPGAMFVMVSRVTSSILGTNKPFPGISTSKAALEWGLAPVLLMPT
jgi:hypothetical protein